MNLFQKMEGERILYTIESGCISAIASRREGQVALFFANYKMESNNLRESTDVCEDDSDKIIIFNFKGLQQGMKKLTIYRIDNRKLWDEKAFLMKAVESRRVDKMPEFQCQCYCPENSVVALFLQDMTEIKV